MNGRFFISSNKSVLENGEFCAPFPACNPSGCDDRSLAPIMCPSCNKSLTHMYLLFLIIFTITIVVVNTIVIVITLRTSDLRKRYGYIKVSLAVSDLLMGLLVLPSTIHNTVRVLYHPRSEGGLTNIDIIEEGSVRSSFFGTIAIVSITTSIYNLTLLSFDRWLAVTYPLKATSGNFFTKWKFIGCIASIWFLGFILSSVPAMTKDTFSYSLDPTTFFYVQTPLINGTLSMTQQRISPYFSLLVLGLPYFATIIFNLATFIITRRNLRISTRIGYKSGSRMKYSKKEQKRRMKAVLTSYPEMDYGRQRSNSWYSRLGAQLKRSSESFSKVVAGNLRINPKPRTRENINAKIGRRIVKMIITMVTVFTVCVAPYFIVMTMKSNGSLSCSNFAIPYLVSACLLVVNSSCNFFIYNAWHRLFREEMYKMFDKIKNKRSISSSNPIVSNPVAAQSSSSESRDTLSKDGTMKTGATKSISLHYTSSSFSTNNNTQVVT